MSTAAEIAAVRNTLALAYAKGDSTLSEYHDVMAYMEAQTVVLPPVVVPPVVVPPVTGTWNPKLKNPKDVVWPYAPKTTSVVNGDLNITQAGQKVSGVAVTGNIVVHATGVDLDNFVAQGLWNQSSALNASIGKLSGSKLDAGFQYSEATLTGVEITQSFDGVKSFSDTHLIDCWIHNLIAGGGYDPSPTTGGAGNSAGGYTHDDGGQISAGANISYLRCRIEDTGYNSGLFIDPDQGAITTVSFLDGFLQGGNFGYFVTHSASSTNPVPTFLEVGRSMFGYAAIPAPAWADVCKVETAAPYNIKVNWHDNVDEDGNPLALNQATPIARRWRKHVWSYDGVH